MSIPLLIWLGLAFAPLSLLIYFVAAESIDRKTVKATTSPKSRERKLSRSMRR